MPVGMLTATSSFLGDIKSVSELPGGQNPHGTSLNFHRMGETWGPLEAGDRAEGVLSPLCGQKVVTEPRRARKGAPGTPRECHPRAASGKGTVKPSFLWSESF